MEGPNDLFARLRLTGGRFDGQGMPVETLGELVAYRHERSEVHIRRSPSARPE
ncbi:MAG: hypothetical protein ACYDH5_10370 [Acidimicrobiales bacterium]